MSFFSRIFSSSKSPDEEHWRVGHLGRHSIFYEEYRDGKWERIEISGEMLLGRTHHVIYFGNAEEWNQQPSWAHHRRDEIIDRIKTTFQVPSYEYDGEAVLSETDQSSLIAAAGGLSDQPCRWANCSLQALRGKQFCVVHSFPSHMWRPSAS
jgi:hypothetical protein